MSNIPTHLKYTESHEWIMVSEDGIATIGITDHAQEALGDLVFVELPAVDDEVIQSDPCAVVESVKAASDLYAPVSGKVVAINEELDADPAIINTDPYDDGWLFKIKLSDSAELDGLKDSDAYAQMLDD